MKIYCSKKRKALTAFSILLFFAGAANGENAAVSKTVTAENTENFENVSSVSTAPTLEAYLSNDIELKKLALEVQNKLLESDKTSISNGISCKLSTGSVVFRTNGNDSSVTFSPTASISVPQASNLSLSASSEIKMGSIASNEQEKKAVTLKLSADILSGAGEKRKVALLKAERTLLEAKRSLQNRALEAEQEYYKKLKELYNTASEIISAQKELYEDTISFEEIKAKGYSKSSSKYRSAEMEVLSDKHTVETKIRDLDHDCAVFAAKCGTSYKSEMHPENFLPSSVPSVEAVDVLSFDKNDYVKMEKALWENKINSMERAADKDFSLSANGGYTFNNSNTTSSSDTVNAGLDFGFNGISLGAGVAVPVTSENTNPVWTVSASVEPNQLRTRKIQKKQNDIENQEENLAIKSASDDYDTSVVDQQTSLADIQWGKQTNSETLKMYSDLESDMKKLFDAGVAKESEYLSAYANRQLYRIKLLLNDVDLIIYNDTTKLLFCRDEEILEKTEN